MTVPPAPCNIVIFSDLPDMKYVFLIVGCNSKYNIGKHKRFSQMWQGKFICFISANMYVH